MPVPAVLALQSKSQGGNANAGPDPLQRLNEPPQQIQSI